MKGKIDPMGHLPKPWLRAVLLLLIWCILLVGCIGPRQPLRERFPSLYATYYVVALANRLGLDLSDHEAKTLSWLREGAEPDGTYLMSHSQIVSSREDTLDNIYYATGIMDELDLELPYHDATVAALQSIQMRDGSFGMFPEEPENLLSERGFEGGDLLDFRLINTYRALTALHRLDALPTNVTATLTWLLARWQEVTAPLDAGNAIMLENAWKVRALLECFDFIGFELATLPHYRAIQKQTQAWERQLAEADLDYSTIDNALTLQTMAQLLQLPAPDFGLTLIPRLLQVQHSDGGFNLWLDVHSDLLGTFEAVSVILDSGVDLPKQAELVAWIERRTNPHGGYTIPTGCSVPDENIPSNCDYIVGDEP